MSVASFVLSFVAVVLALGAAAATGTQVARGLRVAPGSLHALVATVIGVSTVVICAEGLGLVGWLRRGPLIVVLVMAAGAARVWASRQSPAPSAGAPRPAPASPPPSTAMRRLAIPCAAAAVVLGQWLLATADAYGGGMFNFDTLWYHMPFAAAFAQTGSVTGIDFTLADPWVAYYPANSELVHAVGLVLVGGDLLSPLLNLAWLGLLALSAWCFGRPWGREAETFVAGCALASLPVLASTQPGEAFNDIAGLAMLLAAAALLVNRAPVIAAGLALGFALGVKFTFLVPGLILASGFMFGARSRRQQGVFAVAATTTAGWWYVRNIVRVGNPLGTRVHLGPLTLPGPRSPLADGSQQTVISQVRHLSLWGSRFLPGLTHMFGVLWPALLAAALIATVAALAASRHERGLRALGLAAGAGAVTYLVLPTGAAGLSTGTALFEVNLRYATPAVALALLILAVTTPARARHWASAGLLATLGVAQAERSLWPASPARHAGFLVLAAVAIAAVGAIWTRAARPRTVPARVTAGAVATVAVLAAGYAVQHHYLQRRYRTVLTSDPRLGQLFAWGQTIAHARIALYGTAEQYPLAGELVSNRVDYLGVHTPGGGYAPITDCATWRTAVDRDHAGYVVMTPGPTGAAPLAWTAADPAARVVLAPGPGTVVFTLSAPLNPSACPAG